MGKRFLKLAALVALGSVSLFGLAACGSDKVEVSDGGKVLNVRVWNDEFIQRFRDYYPGVKDADKKPADGKVKEEYTLKDGTVVKFQITTNQGNTYQDALDTVLRRQSELADPDAKVDMFLFEADYALKYVNSSYTVDVKELGLTDDDTKDMYQYTKDIATADKKLKGVSWQATPGLFAYRADIAKSVLGTDDPAEVQAKLSDWTKFDAVAAQMKTAGYTMLSGYDDAYRVFSNNISAPLVNSKKQIVIDEQLNKWIEQTKRYTDNGYNHKTSLWDTEWAKQQTINGNTFGFFYSTWGINFTLAGNAEVEDAEGHNLVGKYRVCEGPASFFWGGTWMAAANGTDNKSLVADIMKKLTCDATIAETITRETLDYTNNKPAMNKLANDSTYGAEFLGGQNHIKLFAKAADHIDMSKCSAYDQGINEKLQEAMKDYFAGKVTLDKAWDNFYEKVLKVYPALKRK